MIWSGEGNGDPSGIYARQFGSAIGVNQSPSAVIQGVLNIVEGNGLQLDASNSFDPDGSIASYEWDLNHDGIADFTGSNLSLTWAQLQSLGIQASSATPYSISLRVVDNLGWSNVANANLTVGDTSPSITVTGSGSAVQQNDYTVSFSAVDPGTETISKWIVQWGDGTSDELAAGSSTATHRYSSTGNFSILVQLQDGDGVHNAVAHQVTVVAGNAAPVAADDSFHIAHGGAISGANVTQWFNDAWDYRRLLQVPLADNSVSLTNHPILIRLHATASDAIRVDYGQFAANGNDLRFIDLAGNQLAYQIESWNPNGYSSIWVNIPQLETAGNKNQFYMYYGNSGASAGASPSAVWNSQYVGVYHLNSDTADSTTNALDGTDSSLTGANGQIAGGRMFNGFSSALDLGSAPQLDNLFDGGGSVSAWIYLFGWGENGFGRILDKSDSTSAANGFAFQVAQTAGTDGQLIFEQGFSGSVGRWRTAGGSISLFQWHFVTLTYDNSSSVNTPTIYIDGVQQTLTVSAVPTGTRQSDATSSMTVGNRDDATDRTFFGVIDEVRLSQAIENSQWVMQSYRSAESAPVQQLEVTEHPLSVRSNDVDAESDPLVVSLVTGPAHASSFTLTAAGTFSYQHNGNFATQDSFVYRITDSSGGSSTATATIQIASVNTAPTISTISNQAISEDQSTGPIPFTVGDAEQAASSLVVTAQSSDSSVVTNSAIAIAGSGANRSLTITPMPNAFGTTVISVTVSDGITSTTRNFNLSVSSVNDAPTVTPILNQNVLEDSGPRAVAFSINDVETSTSSLVVSASSSNPSVISNAQLILSGTGAQRQLQFSPNSDVSGTTTITVTVSDGSATTSTSFVVTVNAVNDAPLISNLSDQIFSEVQTPTPIAFTISDVDSPLGSLTTQVQSSNPQLIAPADLIVMGNGNARSLSWSSQPNVYGSSIITITVSDGVSTSNRSFQLTVVQNSAPTISVISPVSLDEDQSPVPIAFTVQDAETASGSLILSVQSSNQSLISDQSIQIAGSGTNRNIAWTPVANSFGTAVITISVSDGTITTTRDLSVTVNPVNDTPVANDDLIKQIGQQDIIMSLNSLLSNDSDVDGDSLQWSLISQPSHGRLELVNGSLRYIATDFGATNDSFTYRVFDGTAWSDPATVQLQLDTNSLAGFINLALNSGNAAISPTSTGSSAPSDAGDSSIDQQPSEPKAASSQRESSTTGSTVDLASQISMAMVAQTAPHATHSHDGQNTDLIATLHSNETLARLLDGTATNEMDSGSPANQTQLSEALHGQDEINPSQPSEIHSNWMNATPTDGLTQPLLWQKISELRQELRSSLTVQSSLTVGTAATTTAGMTVGYVAWVMRSGLLFSSMMTQLPIWRFMDPLAILESTENEDSENDEETINSMVDGHWESDESVDDETQVNV